MSRYKKSETRILSIIVLIIIALDGVIYLSHRSSGQLVSSSEQIEQSREIKYNIENMLRVCADIETGARGYTLTGDEDYLEPANKALAAIYINLNRLSSIADNEEATAKNILRLNELIDQKISISTRMIELRREKGIEEATTYMNAMHGRNVMDQIRAITDKMLKDADETAAKLEAENDNNVKVFNFYLQLLVVLISLMIISVFFALRYYFKQRRSDAQLLSENKELLQTIMDQTSSVIFIKDLAGKYTFINRRFARLFNTTFDEMKGKTDKEIFSKEAADMLRKSDLEVMRTEKLMEVEEELPINGETRTYIIVKFPLTDNDKSMYAVCSIATDVTERKRLELAVKARSNNILELFNNAPCGYHTVNQNGIIVEMNDTELNCLGYEREEIIGAMHLLDLLDEDSKRIYDATIKRLEERKISTIHNVEMKMMRKDGSFISVLCNIVPMFDGSGKIMRTRTSMFDISLRKQAESAYWKN